LFLQAGLTGATDVKFDCPCSIVSNGASSIVVTAGLSNYDATTSGTLRLRVIAHSTPSLFDSGSYTLARVHLDTTQAGNSMLPSAAYKVGFVTLDQDPAYFTLLLDEDVGGGSWVRRDSIRMNTRETLTEVPGGSRNQSSEDAAAAVFMDGSPSFSLNGSQATVGLPAIHNMSLASPTGTLEVQIRRTATDEFFGSFFPVGSESLGTSLAAQGSIAAQQLVMSLSLGGTSGDYFHLTVVDTGTDQSLAWELVQGPGSSARMLNLTGIEMLTDNDNDGVGNYNERFVGTDPDNAGSKPGASTVDVVVYYSQGAPAAASNDIDARIDHLMAFTNQVFTDSDVPLALNVVHREQKTMDEDVDNGTILDAMDDQTAPFTTLRADKAAVGADIAIALRPITGSPSDCGIATLGGGSLEADLVSEGNLELSNTALYVDCDDSTTPHEVGHIMGLAHSRVQVASGDGQGTFNWALGHGVDTEFVTIMGYSSAFSGAPEINMFSSPDLVCSPSPGNDFPCGIAISDRASGADGAQALDVTRFQVAAYDRVPGEGDDAIVLPTDGVARSAGFAAANEEDYFSFFAAPGRTYRVETSALGAGVDTRVDVLNAVGSLGTDDDSGAGAASRLDVVPTAGGRYLAKVSDAGGSTGSYSLSVSETLPEAVDPGVVLVAAVLPTSRSVQVGSSATAFLTLINGGTAQGNGCSIAPATSLPVDFSFQRTDLGTNALVGDAFTSVDLGAGLSQTYVAVVTPHTAFASTALEFRYICDNSAAATALTGINTLQLSASDTPIPDVVALAATVNNDGIVHIPDTSGTLGFFALATFNVGASGTLSVTANTGGASLPVTLSLCETDPSTGACTNPGSPTTGTVTTTIGAGATPTYAIFVAASEAVSLDPAGKRAFVEFRDGGGVVRGSTSVAVQTD
jgi:hypothetical protein